MGRLREALAIEFEQSRTNPLIRQQVVVETFPRVLDPRDVRDDDRAQLHPKQEHDEQRDDAGFQAFRTTASRWGLPLDHEAFLLKFWRKTGTRGSAAWKKLNATIC